MKFSAKKLRESVEWLWDNKCGCCHWHLLTDDNGREWSIVLGWNCGGYEDDEELYTLNGDAIACKIAYQEHNTGLQCDMDWDFTMPYSEETGEVDDTLYPISRNEDYVRLVKELLNTFTRVVNDWAYFEEEFAEAV